MGVAAPTQEDLHAILVTLDDDGNGDVGKDEFLSLIMLVLEKMIEAEQEVQENENHEFIHAYEDMLKEFEAKKRTREKERRFDR